MARRVSSRKKPLREVHMLKEQRKLESEVFDRPTLIVLSKMMKKGIFESLDYPVNTGKEANVFRATTLDGAFLAVKIYKFETAPFFRKIEYLEGDPRFKGIKHNDKGIVLAFARKEFKNLKVCEAAGVHVPQPLYIDKNVLVMSFIGEAGIPYSTLNQRGPGSEKDLDSVLEDIRKMYRAGLVHADVSEYNILMSDPPTLIDFGQGVVLGHPKSMEFLERDVRNTLHAFEKYGIKRDLQKTLEWVKS
jgi:RIO kinase 1